MIAARQGGGVLAAAQEPKPHGRGNDSPKWQPGEARTCFASAKEQEIR